MRDASVRMKSVGITRYSPAAPRTARAIGRRGSPGRPDSRIPSPMDARPSHRSPSVPNGPWSAERTPAGWGPNHPMRMTTRPPTTFTMVSVRREVPRTEVPRRSRPCHSYQFRTTTGGRGMFNDNGSFLLGLFEFFIFFAWFMCLFYIFGDIFRSKDLGGLGKTLWSLFVIFLPFLGVLVYLIARGGGMTERSMEAQARAQRQQDEYIRSVATSTGGTSSADQIASAKHLLDDGAINQA